MIPGETNEPYQTPGSPEAVAAGCTCPVLRNEHGRGVPDWGWLIADNCPLHAVDWLAEKETGRSNEKD
jgi:hypothetical protein